MLITCEEDLDAALACHDPYLMVDGSREIQVSGAKVLDYPVTLTGGRFQADDGPIFVVASDDVQITGAKLTGGLGSSVTYSQPQKLIFGAGTMQNQLNNVAIRGCTFRDSRADNIWLEWCNDALIADNSIRRYLYSAVMNISPDRALVSGNSLGEAPLLDSPGAPVNVYGIAFTDTDNTDIARARDCTAVGNLVYQVAWEGMDTHGGDNISFVGNTIIGCPTGIAFVTGNESRTGAPTSLLASGNIINGRDATKPLKRAIWLGGLAGKPADGVVTGNQIDGYETPFGIDYVDRARLNVSGNSAPLVPWTNIVMGPDFSANSSFVPRYTVDGNLVSVTGMAVPKNSTRKIIGRIANTHAWPDKLTFLGESHGSNAAAGRMQIGVWGSDSPDYPPGTVQAFYPDGGWTDGYSYPLFGTYEAV